MRIGSNPSVSSFMQTSSQVDKSDFKSTLSSLKDRSSSEQLAGSTPEVVLQRTSQLRDLNTLLQTMLAKTDASAKSITSKIG